MTGIRTRMDEDTPPFDLMRPMTRDDAKRALEHQLRWLDHTSLLETDRKTGDGVIFIGLDDPVCRAMGFDALVIWCAQKGLVMAVCPGTRMVGLYRSLTTVH
jgi:hypothetical protein